MGMVIQDPEFPPEHQEVIIPANNTIRTILTRIHISNNTLIRLISSIPNIIPNTSSIIRARLG